MAKIFKHRKKIVFDNLDKKDEIIEKNEISFMQPEILPLETMKNLLKLKGFFNETLLRSNDSAIIKLFYKHVTPKPQRQYKYNRTGQLLLKRRLKIEGSRKSKNCLESLQLIDRASSSSKLNKTSNLASSFKETTTDRLKSPPPPVSCINIERKRIKLNSSGSKNLDNNSQNNKLTLDTKSHLENNSKTSSSNKRESDNKTPEAKKRKPITWP